MVVTSGEGILAMAACCLFGGTVYLPPLVTPIPLRGLTQRGSGESDTSVRPFTGQGDLAMETNSPMPAENLAGERPVASNEHDRRDAPRIMNPEALPRSPGGRVCEWPGCTTVLSVYNGSRRCWVHSDLDFGRRAISRRL